jgi:hypothetical protein
MNRTKRTATTRKNGFTILQMIATIAIIAVVTTFEFWESQRRAPNSDFRIPRGCSRATLKKLVPIQSAATRITGLRIVRRNLRGRKPRMQ